MKLSDFYFRLAEDEKVKELRFGAVASYKRMPAIDRYEANLKAASAKEAAIQYELKGFKEKCREVSK